MHRGKFQTHVVRQQGGRGRNLLLSHQRDQQLFKERWWKPDSWVAMVRPLREQTLDWPLRRTTYEQGGITLRLQS